MTGPTFARKFLTSEGVAPGATPLSMYGNLRMVLAVFAFSAIHSSPALVGETRSNDIVVLSAGVPGGVSELALLRETETDTPRPWGGNFVENCMRNTRKAAPFSSAAHA